MEVVGFRHNDLWRRVIQPEMCFERSGISAASVGSIGGECVIGTHGNYPASLNDPARSHDRAKPVFAPFLSAAGCAW
ncbi:MAG TPA: hypothetical protein VMU81_20665 [Acetobacteraceae bacterium]|jgi:hypothetical protein|nr:hypothetical protein [Acetobacteraceae bacterium]